MDTSTNNFFRIVITKIVHVLLVAVDLLLACFIYVGIAAYGLWLLLFRFRLRQRWMATGHGKRRLLILSGSGYSDLISANRGFGHLEALSNPYLEYVFFMNPSTREPHVFQLSESFQLVDWGTPYWSRTLRRLRLWECARLLEESIILHRLVRFCITESVGLVRTMDHVWSGLRGALLHRVLGIPLIIDVRANYELIYRMTGSLPYFSLLAGRTLTRPLAHWFSNCVMSWTLLRADLVFGGNRNNYEHAFALGADPRKLFLVRVDIDQRFLQGNIAIGDTAPPDLSPNILFVSRLSPEKFPLDVLEAFVLVAQEHPSLHLVIAGDGPLAAVLQAFANKNDLLTDRIHFLGFCLNEKVAQLMRQASVVLCPYSGSVLIEALLSERAVVAYDIEWHSELVIDGLTGLLADFRDIRDLADKISVVISDPKAAEEMGRRGRELTLCLFDLQRIQERERRFYTRLLAGKV